MNNRKYDKLSLDEGLSQSIVYSIIQDKDGFMWFGTQEGLNRYDGHNFRIFKKSLEDKNSIYSNYIKTIFQDIDGTIWLGTYSSGLIKYDENYGSFERIIIDTDENIPESYLITGILDCPDGTLAIGTFKGGMKILNKETNEVTHFLSSESGEMRNFPNEITCMTFSDSGALWIGTVYNGIYIYDYKDMTFTNIKNELSDIESIRSERIHFIYKDFNNFIWISTENGLNIYDEKNNCFLNHRFLYKDKEIIINQITSICEDKNNFI